jgi:hypothetical protein
MTDESAVDRDPAETRVPADRTAHDCPYCGRPFPRQRAVTLHVGLDHGDSADDDEVAAFQNAYRDERDELRRFQLLALAVLVALYFGFLFAYAVFA